LEGEMVLRVQENRDGGPGSLREIPIRAGETFLLPPRTPHSPQRMAGGVGLVIERKRLPHERDGLLWYCERCNHKLYEEFFQLQDIEQDFPPVFDRFFASVEKRTCGNCGHVHPPRAAAPRGIRGDRMSDIAALVRELDAADPLRGFRDEFLVPPHGGGEQRYFVGNSLGLQPRGARAHVLEVLDKWAAEAVEGHFSGDTAWMEYHRLVREPLARLVGARPDEVVAMNTLTVNLHLMLASFYRPDARRPVVLMEAGAFPSDRHAVESQIRLHGLDPAECLVEVEADEPNGTLSDQAIADAIAAHGPRLALVLWPGIQYRTGQAFDLARIAALAHAQGARVGFDLAHAVGNLPLALHDAGADFAV